MIYVCGFPRSGTSMFYLMLRTTVKNYRFFDSEMPAHKGVGNQITKRPLDIWENYPNRRAIKLIKDPRAILTSRHWSAPDEYFVSADVCTTGHRGLLDIWEAYKHKEAFEVRYEQLVTDTDTVQDAIGSVFDFEYSGRFVDFHKAQIPFKLQRPLNGVRPVDKGHDWRDHPERIKQQFKAFPALFDVLVESGYEKDDSWFDSL